MKDSPVFLLAESGASKTAWRLCHGNQVAQEFESMGLNPSAVKEKELLRALDRSLLQLKGTIPHAIYFYGAGLKYQENIELLAGSLTHFFPNALVEIQDDMKAAVRATGKAEGIVAIMGTGSNAAYYKNDKILQNYGGHGYLLGDEGSGMDLGKQLLKAMLDGKLPRELHEYVLEREQMELGELRTSVYLHKQPNRRLAALAPYLKEGNDLPEVRSLIRNRFEKFIETSIQRVANYQQLPLDFVGGIACHFTKDLLYVCKKYDLQVDNFIPAPIDKLVEYHSNP
ncbi:MAG: hypothetical protein R8P61_09445 [Bacteroidia bacterium]|nr:hypothetical protein [Bacteroidia bacterium]